jgi:hypothetical protein
MLGPLEVFFAADVLDTDVSGARFFAEVFRSAAFVGAVFVDPDFFDARLVDDAVFAEPFFGDACFVVAPSVGVADGDPAPGSTTGALPASGVVASSAGTMGSAPISGVERRLARSPDARAAPAASAPWRAAISGPSRCPACA